MSSEISFLISVRKVLPTSDQIVDLTTKIFLVWELNAPCYRNLSRASCLSHRFDLLNCLYNTYDGAPASGTVTLHPARLTFRSSSGRASSPTLSTETCRERDEPCVAAFNLSDAARIGRWSRDPKTGRDSEPSDALLPKAPVVPRASSFLL